MSYGARHTFVALALAALAACASPPAAPPATPVAVSAPTATALPVREATRAPASVATPTVAPSVAPPTTQPTAAPSVAPPTTQPTAQPTAQPAPQLPEPTATPAFPEPRITADSLASLQLLRTVGYGGAVHAAIAPDNRLLAVATTAGVALFALPSLRHQRFDAIPGGAVTVAFSDDAQALLVTVDGGGDRQLQRRRIADGTLEDARPIAFAPRPTELLSPAGAVRASLPPLDSVPSPGVILARGADGSPIYRDDETLAVAFSADETLAALVTYRGDVRLVDLADGRVRGELALPPYWGVGFSPDAQTLVTTGHMLWQWDVVAGTARQPPLALGAAAQTNTLGAQQRVRASADGSVLTVEGEYVAFEATLLHGKAFRTANGALAPAWERSAGGSGVLNVATYVGALSPASDAVAATDDGVTLRITGGGAPPRTLPIPEGIGALAFSPDGKLLAIGDRAGQVRLVAVEEGAEAGRIAAGDAVRGLVFSPGGELLGARTAGGLIAVWRAATLEPVAQITAGAPAAAPEIAGFAQERFLFTADGALLIAWGPTSVRFHQLRDGALRHTIAAGADGAAVGPRGRILALLQDGRVLLWGVP